MAAKKGQRSSTLRRQGVPGTMHLCHVLPVKKHRREFRRFQVNGMKTCRDILGCGGFGFSDGGRYMHCGVELSFDSLERSWGRQL